MFVLEEAEEAPDLLREAAVAGQEGETGQEGLVNQGQKPSEDVVAVLQGCALLLLLQTQRFTDSSSLETTVENLNSIPYILSCFKELHIPSSRCYKLVFYSFWSFGMKLLVCGEQWSRRTVNRWDGGSIPPTAISKLRQFRLSNICLCLSEETLKAGGPFYLVSMSEEVKDPTQGETCNL